MNAHTDITAAVPQVYGAISDVMAVMAKEGISKDRRNGQQGYNFRGIDDVFNALSSVMAEKRLVMLPFVQDRQREERQTKSGGSLTYTILTVDFTLVSANDGSTCIVRTEGEAMDSADKSTNKAMSAALKYAALMVFMIPTEGGNDADQTTHDVAPRQRQQREPAQRTEKPAGGAKVETAAKPATASTVEEPKGGWGDWARDTVAFIARAKTAEALDDFLAEENDRIIAARRIDKAMFAAIRKADADRRDVLSGKILDDDVPY